MGLDKGSVCYTIDLKNSPIDANTLSLFRKWEEKGLIQLFKLKNGTTRVVVCIEKHFHDAVLEGSSFLLIKGIEINMLKDSVTMIKVDQIIQEI